MTTKKNLVKLALMSTLTAGTTFAFTACSDDIQMEDIQQMAEMENSGLTRAEAEGYNVNDFHVNYDGTKGKPLEVRRNFRDYLVWNCKGDLIAIVTLTKENGALSDTPAFGGPWFSDYNAFLKAHKGEALVFVYAGWMELVLTPDGGVFNPQGTDVSRYLEGVEAPYEIFRCDAASYTP